MPTEKRQVEREWLEEELTETGIIGSEAEYVYLLIAQHIEPISYNADILWYKPWRQKWFSI